MQKTKSMAPGFTIVESLVAMAIVATISLAGLGTMTYMRGVKNRSKEICLAHVSGTVEKFRSIGYFAAANNFTPYETNSNFTASLVPPALSLNPRGIADTDMYPSTQILEYPGTAGAPTINNQVLIASSINALLAIYNSNTAFCQAPEGAAYADTAAAPLYQGFGSPSPELGPSAALTLKIESYNTKTGAMDPCTTGLKIAPPGKYEDTDPGSPHYPAFRKATRGAPKDKGLLLTVTQTYNDEEGFPQKCSITQRFQYGADVTPPNPPNYMDLTQTTAPLIIQSSNCRGTNNNYTLTFGYQGVGNEIEPGSVLVCRDASFYPNPITTGQTVTGVVAAQCRGSGRPANFVPALAGGAQVPVGQTGVNYAGAYPSIDASTSRPWVPCDKVTLCGRTPVNAAIVGTPNQPRYQLRYANLPPLCRAYIQVAAIDTASNSSQPVIGAASDSSHLTPNTSSTFDGMWDIPMARCGQQCGPNMWVPAGSVYFQCGGCP